VELYYYLSLIEYNKKTFEGTPIFNQILSYYDKTKLINYLIIIYAFLLPISRSGISIITALLFLLWVLDANLKERLHTVFNNKTTQAIVLFFGFSIVSLLWSENKETGFITIITYWYLLPIFIFSTHVKFEELFKIISAFLFGMLISEILSYGIFFELWTLRHGSPMDPTPFMNHLQYAMFLTFASLLLFNRFFFETQLKWRIFYFIYFLTVTSNLFLNGGRTGHFAFAISIFVVGFLNIKNKFLAFFSMLALVSAIFFTAYHVSPVFKIRFDQAQVETSTISNDAANQYNGSFGQRLGAWVVGIEIFKDHPILGTGTGSEMDALKEKIANQMPEMKMVENIAHYHNNYMAYIVSLGIIGLFLYLNIFYQVLKLDIQNKELSNLKYIFITVFSVASLVEYMFMAQFPLALFGLFVGIFISSSTQKY